MIIMPLLATTHEPPNSKPQDVEVVLVVPASSWVWEPRNGTVHRHAPVGSFVTLSSLIATCPSTGMELETCEYSEAAEAQRPRNGRHMKLRGQTQRRKLTAETKWKLSVYTPQDISTFRSGLYKSWRYATKVVAVIPPSNVSKCRVVHFSVGQTAFRHESRHKAAGGFRSGQIFGTGPTGRPFIAQGMLQGETVPSCCFLPSCRPSLPPDFTSLRPPAEAR